MIDTEAALSGDRQKPEEVAAGERGDEGLFGVEGGGVGEGEADGVWRGGAGHFESAIEAEKVAAAIALVEEGLVVAGP